MVELSKIKKNTFYTVITISSRLIANVLLFWLLARYFGPELFGQFTFAHTLSTIFIVFADFGLDIILTTKLAADKGNDSKIFEKLLGLKVIFLILATSLMLLTSTTFNLNNETTKLVIIFSIYLIFTSSNNFFAGVFKGNEKFILETRVSILSNSFLVVSTIFLLIFNRSIIEIAFAFAFSRIIGTIYSILNLYKTDYKLTFKFDLSGFKLLGGKVLIFGFHLIFSFLFFQIDTLLLAKLKGAYSVGIYQAVFKLVMLPLVIPDILINSLLPTLSRYYTENKEEWIKLGSLMGKILFILALPFSTIMIFYSESIIEFAYGLNGYQDAVDVLKVFGIIILIRFVLEPFALMLTTSDRQFIRLITVLIATILSISLNYLIIPKYGVLGASFVSLVVNLFVGLIYFLSLKGNFSFWLFSIRQGIAIIIVFSVGYIFFKFIYLPTIVELPIILAIYTIIGYKYYLNKDEKNIFLYVLGKLNIVNQK